MFLACVCNTFIEITSHSDMSLPQPETTAAVSSPGAVDDRPREVSEDDPPAEEVEERGSSEANIILMIGDVTKSQV